MQEGAFAVFLAASPSATPGWAGRGGGTDPSPQRESGGGTDADPPQEYSYLQVYPKSPRQRRAATDALAVAAWEAVLLSRALRWIRAWRLWAFSHARKRPEFLLECRAADLRYVRYDNYIWLLADGLHREADEVKATFVRQSRSESELLHYRGRGVALVLQSGPGASGQGRREKEGAKATVVGGALVFGLPPLPQQP